MGWSASTTAAMAQRYSHIGSEAQRQALDSLVEPTEASRWSDALLTNWSDLTTAPKTVPTLSAKRCVVVALARLVTGGFTCGNIAQYLSVTLGVFGAATATNQEAAGSSPAGRANLFRCFLLPPRRGHQKCGHFCGYPSVRLPILRQPVRSVDRMRCTGTTRQKPGQHSALNIALHLNKGRITTNETKL